MPFHPKSLDHATLRRMAKAMKTKSSEVLAAPITLSQSQELLVRALGYADWHQAVQTQKEETIPASDPYLNPACRMRWYGEMSTVFSSYTSTNRKPLIHEALGDFCVAAREYGRQPEADIVDEVRKQLAATPSEADIHAKTVADFISRYSDDEAMAIGMLARSDWREAFREAARRAERLCNIADYARLGAGQEDAVARATQGSLRRVHAAG